MSMNNTFLIPEANLADLEKKVAQINKKASKLATPPVTLTRTGVVTQVKTSVGGRIAERLGGNGSAVCYTYNAVEVIVEGSAPVVAGWEFVAVIRHKLTENQFITVPGSSYADFSEYEFAPKNCDHCKKNRVRNASYIVKNVETGALMQVGSTCLSDFTGWNDPQQAAKAAENIWKLFHDHIPAYRIVPRTTKSFHIEEWMAFVAQAIREHGWLSRSNSMNGNATADRAKVAILGYYQEENVAAPTDEDFTTARNMIEWARGAAHEEMGPSDFKDNLMASFAPEYIDEAAMGTSAAVFAAKWRVEREAAKSAAQATQGFVGTKGDKLTLDVTIDREPGGGDFGFGFTHIYNMTDGTNKFVVFSKNDWGVEVGDKLTITAKVKDHKVDNYSGDKVTSLNYCKVIA